MQVADQRLNNINPTDLADAVTAGNLLSQAPISCLLQLIDGYSGCNTVIPDDKVKAAYQAFADTSKYEPLDLKKLAYEQHLEDLSIFPSMLLFIFICLFYYSDLFLHGLWFLVRR